MKKKESQSAANETTVKMAVRAVIYAEASKWLKTEIKSGDAIPWLRNGTLQHRHQTVLGAQLGVEYPILKAAEAQSKDVLSASLDRLKNCHKAIEAAAQAYSKLSFEETARSGTAKRSEQLELRIINALGLPIAFPAVADAALEALSVKIQAVEAELTGRPTGPGRPRNEAAYRVARALAEVYVQITGRRPTFSENTDGLHGEYTPALQSVFDALGLKHVDLRGPATAAVEFYSDDVVAELCNSSKSWMYLPIPTLPPK